MTNPDRAVLDTALKLMEANRARTLGTLDEILKQPNPAAALAWRVGPGRSHLAWQLTHIGITEEIFATERLFNLPSAFADLAPRFRGGSTPDDDIPSAELIRTVLHDSREHLRAALAKFTDADLSFIPENLRERGWNLERVLQVLVWHEAHHQGQAHIMLNSWKRA